MRSTRAFLIGAGAAYLLDPRNGRRRRNELRDRSLAALRRGARIGARRARFVGGHARGAVAISRRAFTDTTPALDDRTVAQRIRSDAFRSAGVSTKDVELSVDDGVATLHGAVDERAAADELVARVAKVPGVREVAAMIRISAPPEYAERRAS